MCHRSIFLARIMIEGEVRQVQLCKFTTTEGSLEPLSFRHAIADD